MGQQNALQLRQYAQRTNAQVPTVQYSSTDDVKYSPLGLIHSIYTTHRNNCLSHGKVLPSRQQLTDILGPPVFFMPNGLARIRIPAKHSRTRCIPLHHSLRRFRQDAAHESRRRTELAVTKHSGRWSVQCFAKPHHLLRERAKAKSGHKSCLLYTSPSPRD